MKITIARAGFVCVSLTLLGLMVARQSNAKLDLIDTIGIWLFNEGDRVQTRDSSGNENHG